MSVKVRFAPSPTGRLHVGNGFVALHNWLLARKAGGHFLLRLDDTDAKLAVARAEAQLALTERAQQKYGALRIEAVMLSQPWYLDHAPKLKARFEDRTIALPRHADIKGDFRLSRVPTTVAGEPRGRWARRADDRPMDRAHRIVPALQFAAGVAAEQQQRFADAVRLQAVAERQFEFHAFAIRGGGHVAGGRQVEQAQQRVAREHDAAFLFGEPRNIMVGVVVPVCRIETEHPETPRELPEIDVHDERGGRRSAEGHFSGNLRAE